MNLDYKQCNTEIMKIIAERRKDYYTILNLLKERRDLFKETLIILLNFSCGSMSASEQLRIESVIGPIPFGIDDVYGKIEEVVKKWDNSNVPSLEVGSPSSWSLDGKEMALNIIVIRNYIDATQCGIELRNKACALILELARSILDVKPEQMKNLSDAFLLVHYLI